jgi:hypothetical protein
MKNNITILTLIILSFFSVGCATTLHPDRFKFFGTSYDKNYALALREDGYAVVYRKMLNDECDRDGAAINATDLGGYYCRYVCTYNLWDYQGHHISFLDDWKDVAYPFNSSGNINLKYLGKWYAYSITVEIKNEEGSIDKVTFYK